MYVYHDLPSQPLPRPTLLTIGNFDGVHLGHQALIAEMLQTARSRQQLAGVLTFDRHPLTVLAPERSLFFLSNLDERQALLAGLGLDFAVILPFNRKTAQTPAADFVASLKERLSLEELWVGPDFTLGRRKEGDVASLQELGEELGFSLRVVPPFCLGGTSVRSTRIRSLLQAGDVREAARLLGRPYRVWGHIIPSTGLIRGPGTAWLTLALEPHRVLPCHGTYAGWADVAEERSVALIAIGGPPTSECAGSTRSVEVSLPDLRGPLLGKPVALTFVQRLQAGPTQQSVDEALHQIARDLVARCGC